jgi:hypothetical protein
VVEIVTLVNFFIPSWDDSVFLRLFSETSTHCLDLKVVPANVVAHVEPHKFIFVLALILILLVDVVRHVLQLVLFVHMIVNFSFFPQHFCVLEHVVAIFAVLVPQVLVSYSFRFQACFRLLDPRLFFHHFPLPLLLSGQLFLPHLLEVEVSELGLHVGRLILRGDVVVLVGIADPHRVNTLQVLAA